MVLSPLDYTRKLATERRIQKVGPVQGELSDFLIGKFREEIIEGLVSLRRNNIDPIAREGRRKRGINYDDYPLGECLWIRDCVYDILQRTPRIVYPKLPHVSPFTMPLRKIWVIQHEKYMQNAIQAGSWIIDGANDTCDRYKYPVTIQRIENSGMRNPRNHADLCTILEKYWGVKCYPNVYYPILAPFSPVIFSFEGKVGFGESSMTRLNASGVFDGFVSAEDFIFDSDFSERRLSPQEEAQLSSIDAKNPIEPCVGTAISLGKVRKMFSHARLYGTSYISAVYLRFLRNLHSSTMELKDGL